MIGPPPGEGFGQHEFHPQGSLLGVNLYSVKDRIIEHIGDAEMGFEVDLEEEIYPIKGNSVYFTYGANPCLAGVLFDKKKKLWIFHNSHLSDEQVAAINNCIGGIVGGGLWAIDEYSYLLKESKANVITPTVTSSSFGIAVVTKKVKDVPVGIFYGYSEIS